VVPSAFLLLVSSGAAVPIAAQSSGTRVVMLGTGTPNPDPERSGPAVAVVVNGRAYLVDAGVGVVRRAAQAVRERKIPALEASRLGIVFITHLHSDHTIGLPDLIHTGWVAERRAPLEVYGPPGIVEMTSHLTAAWKEDIRIRTAGPQPSTPNGWKVNAHVVTPGVVYRDSNVTVTAFAVSHTNWEYAFGYRFDTKDRSIVFSGDTHPVEAVAKACNGCDVLVHEVYSVERLKLRSPEWQRYHRDSHTSTTELAALATQARPKLLVLYHQLYWGATDEDLLREIRQGYAGAVMSGRDLEVY
jgi:ribonuclease BN (tRNA processing enzyme)